MRSIITMLGIIRKELTIFFLTIGLFVSSDFCSGQEWQILTVDEGVKPSIAVDADGLPHVAYMLEAIPGYLRHAILPAGSEDFVITEIDNAYYYGPLDIEIGSDGRPAVALHNHDDEDQNVYWLNESGIWVKHRVRDDGHDGWDNSVVFSADGLLHTSSVDPSQFGETSSIEYAWYDGNGWRVEKIGSGPILYQFSTSIALQSNGNPAISYFDDIGNQLKYALRSGGNWQIMTVPSSGGMFSSLVFDQSDNPHISFYTVANGNSGLVRYAYLNDNLWVVEDIDELSNVPITFTGARNVTSLAVDHRGSLHVVFNDRDELKYAIRAENNWNIETILDRTNSTETLGAQASLALDHESNPHITYFEVTNLNPLRGVIKYVTRKSAITSSHQESDKLKIFPVPAAKDGYLTMPGANENSQILLVDMNGKSLLLSVKDSVISLAGLDLAPGTYFIVLGSDGSESRILRRIILH